MVAKTVDIIEKWNDTRCRTKRLRGSALPSSEFRVPSPEVGRVANIRVPSKEERKTEGGEHPSSEPRGGEGGEHPSSE
jgi:hypothetical protein